jgi:hypothetical protein
MPLFIPVRSLNMIHTSLTNDQIVYSLEIKLGSARVEKLNEPVADHHAGVAHKVVQLYARVNYFLGSQLFHDSYLLDLISRKRVGVPFNISFIAVLTLIGSHSGFRFG